MEARLLLLARVHVGFARVKVEVANALLDFLAEVLVFQELIKRVGGTVDVLLEHVYAVVGLEEALTGLFLVI